MKKKSRSRSHQINIGTANEIHEYSAFRHKWWQCVDKVVKLGKRKVSFISLLFVSTSVCEGKRKRMESLSN